MSRFIEIMDTTLRDGEQTSGVSYSPKEKLTIAKLLIEELNIDRIEVASARVSDGELDSVKQITNWANKNNKIKKIEVLTFLDKGESINWLLKSGCVVQNLLTKGSLNHLKHQLKKTPSDHFKDIEEIIQTAEKNSIETNVYLEDWSNGMKNSREFVMDFLNFLYSQKIKRILLPDTLGILTHYETFEFLSEIKTKFPDFHIDFHGHNDYDLSVGNSMEAIRAGCDGLHLTINGMGERAGNTPLSSAVAAIKDFLPDIKINVDEKNLFKASKLISTFSGQTVSSNKPIVGENVFTQTAGVHADGDNKKNLYYNNLKPSRFGRKRKYALGKTSGKANIKKNLDELGIKINDKELGIVTSKVIELGDKKEKVTLEDLPYIISDVLDYPEKKKNIIIESYVLTHAKTLRPSASLSLIINNKLFQESCSGDGQFDAFMNALKKIYSNQKRYLPKLIDYAVRIPPGSDSDAFCETTITWDTGSKKFKTRGLDTDQTVAAIKATEKMLNTE
ncbi:MAG: 2-isopropylmalate synthase [Flavobacteriales bacterium]|nr:MAG: 2-isopropylmalate synthase [Flavobacteriales bacterium]